MTDPKLWSYLMALNFICGISCFCTEILKYIYEAGHTIVNFVYWTIQDGIIVLLLNQCQVKFTIAVTSVCLFMHNP